MFIRIIMILGIVGLWINVVADDVTDSVEEGLKYYKSGEYSSAIESFSYANQLIKQMKGADLENIFPDPLSGWKAGKATSTATGDAIFGGGVTAERSYEKSSSYVQISIFSDSPLMQSMMMMFTNPMLATSDGGKMIKISGNKAIIKYDDANRSGDIDIVIDSKYLVQITGNDVDRDDLIAYAEAIDFKRLEDMQ